MEKTQIKDQLINLGNITQIPHPELFAMVSKVIAEDTLDTVNRRSSSVKVRKSIYTLYGKRILDIILSIILLVILFPVNFIIGIITLFDVGLPIFFRQQRVGLNNKPFVILKFRNMTNKKDCNGNLLPPAQRVTRFGKFVRKTSLDELLNFWSILKGDMSIIGPRPLLLEYSEKYSNRHKMRHAVRPGLECPVILDRLDRSTWKDQFENDVFYVENVSLFLDLKMLFSLVKMVFDRKSTAIRGNAIKGSFMGYDIDGNSIDSTAVPMKYYLEAVKRLGYESYL